MTEQQIDRDRLRAVADHAEQANSAVYLAPRDLLALLDQLDQAEARIEAWEKQYAHDLAQSDLIADQAEARIRHLEDTARVLVKEVLDAEVARDKHRHGRAIAEARIKAVEADLDAWDRSEHHDSLEVGIRRALGETA